MAGEVAVAVAVAVAGEVAVAVAVAVAVEVGSRQLAAGTGGSRQKAVSRGQQAV